MPDQDSSHIGFVDHSSHGLNVVSFTRYAQQMAIREQQCTRALLRSPWVHFHQTVTDCLSEGCVDVQPHDDETQTHQQNLHSAFQLTQRWCRAVGWYQRGIWCGLTRFFDLIWPCGPCYRRLLSEGTRPCRSRDDGPTRVAVRSFRRARSLIFSRHHNKPREKTKRLIRSDVAMRRMSRNSLEACMSHTSLYSGNERLSTLKSDRYDGIKTTGMPMDATRSSNPSHSSSRIRRREVSRTLTT